MAIRPLVGFSDACPRASRGREAAPFRRLLDEGASVTLAKAKFCGNMPGV
jgi:hypothetical protein